MGSSLNSHNAAIFSTADCSIALEPSLPVICFRHPCSPALSSPKGPIGLAQLLASLPCSLTLSVGQKISLMQVIVQARHLLNCTRASLLFMIMSCLTVSL